MFLSDIEKRAVREKLGTDKSFIKRELRREIP